MEQRCMHLTTFAAKCSGEHLSFKLDAIPPVQSLHHSPHLALSSVLTLGALHEGMAIVGQQLQPLDIA